MSVDPHATSVLKTLMAPVQIVSILNFSTGVYTLMDPSQLIWMLGGEALANKYLRPNYTITKNKALVPSELTWAQSPDSIILALLVACKHRSKAPQGTRVSLPANSVTIYQVYSEAAEQHQRTLNMVSFFGFNLLPTLC